MAKFILNYKFRQWVYGVLIAILGVLAGFNLFDAATHENLETLIAAIVNIGGAAGFVVASRNARPSSLDDKKEIVEQVENIVDHRG